VQVSFTHCPYEQRAPALAQSVPPASGPVPSALHTVAVDCEQSRSPGVQLSDWQLAESKLIAQCAALLQLNCWLNAVPVESQ
jgi:hypothetical protein